jgi:hypothetical protein
MPKQLTDCFIALTWKLRTDVFHHHPPESTTLALLSWRIVGILHRLDRIMALLSK